jgi:alanine racemase
MVPGGNSVNTSLYNKWIEVETEAIKANLASVQSLLDERVRLIAVVKADAYGHGAVEAARILFQNGVDFFAVSYLEEARDLRQGGIRSSLLLFTPLIDEEQAAQALTEHITLSITSRQDAELILKVSERIPGPITVHLKIDTGLGRFGLDRDAAVEICETFRSHPHIYIEGIYTHMAAAAAHPGYTRQQFRRFIKITEELTAAGYRIPVRHCANSTVCIKYPEMRLEAVRIGTLLSGQFPAGVESSQVKLQDPYQFKARIISLRTLPKGSYLGYYRTYRLKKEAQVAVVPVGFNDGLALEVANPPAGFVDLLKILVKTVLAYLGFSRFQLQVIIKGRSYPVRGKVFMQMALVELPREADIKVGDVVALPVRKTLAARNLTRVYVKEGRPCKIEEEGRITYLIKEGKDA